MRIVLTSFGSTGDAQPFLALAVELRARGHHPVLSLSPNFAGHAERQGIEFAPLGPELKPSDIRGVITTQLAMSSPIAQARHFLDTVMPIMPDVFRQLRAACSGADLLVSAPHQIAGRMVHEALDIPYVTVHLSHFGGNGSRDLREATAPVINACRVREGLPPLFDPLTADAASPQLAVYAISRYILRPSANWPGHHHVSGFFFLDDRRWQPDPALADFLAAGDAPVIFNFGSVVHEDPDALTGLLLDAVGRTGRRAIIQHGWSGLAERPLPENVHAVGFTPHNWLLPRAACLVHHGGAGTTAAALRAGVPTVVVPHTLDQPIWGEFARALGCAGAVIPHAQLTAERLGAALAKTLGSARHRVTAAALGQKVAQERGVENASLLIEQMAAGGPRALVRAA